MKFLNRVLQALDGIYRFVGGQRSTSSVDLSSPVVIVHDVGRQAEYASGFYANLFESAALAASTRGFLDFTMAEIMATAGIASEMAQRGMISSGVDVWVCEMWESVTVATEAAYELGAVGFQTVARPGGASLVGVRALATPTIGLTVAGVVLIAPAVPDAVRVFPALLGRGDQVALGLLYMAETNATVGGMTWGAHALIWIGPVGTRPPGVA